MWTVLLVEDEVFVRESIRESVDWKKYGFKVIGEASNGKEALSFIYEHEPDLVIADILMPIMDGIELLKRSRETGFDGLFLMLSCLNEFEYVRQAMEYGASNYILKLSMSVQSFKDALEKIKVELLSRKGKGIKEIEQYYHQLWKLIHEGNHMSAELELPSFLLQDYKLTIFSFIHQTRKFKELDFYNLEIVKHTGKEIIHLFQHLGHTTVFYWSKETAEINESFFRKETNNAFYSVLNKGERIEDCWKRSLSQLNSLWYEKEKPDSFDTLSIQQLSQITREIIQRFELMNQPECLSLLEEMWKLIEENQYPFGIVKEIVVELDRKLMIMTENNEDQPINIIDCLRYSHFKRLFTEKVQSLYENRIDRVGITSDHIEINKVIEYIKCHYYEQLTVKQLAEYVAMDKNYLSSLFKKKTGESIIQFIHRVRITHAKFKLTHSDLPIHLVAEKVGFTNDNYFIRIFKRTTKYTPSRYRKIK